MGRSTSNKGLPRVQTGSPLARTTAPRRRAALVFRLALACGALLCVLLGLGRGVRSSSSVTALMHPAADTLDTLAAQHVERRRALEQGSSGGDDAADDADADADVDDAGNDGGSPVFAVTTPSSASDGGSKEADESAVAYAIKHRDEASSQRDAVLSQAAIASLLHAQLVEDT